MSTGATCVCVDMHCEPMYHLCVWSSGDNLGRFSPTGGGEGPGTELSVSALCPVHFIVFEAESLTELRAPGFSYTGWSAQRAPGILPHKNFRHIPPRPGLCVCAGDLNSYLYDYTATLIATEAL